MDTSDVYRHVVDEVVASMRTDFQNDGVEETVLLELQQLWETKLRQTGAVQLPGYDDAALHSAQIAAVPEEHGNSAYYSGGSAGYDLNLAPSTTVVPSIGRPQPYMAAPNMWTQQQDVKFDPGVSGLAPVAQGSAALDLFGSGGIKRTRDEAGPPMVVQSRAPAGRGQPTAVLQPAGYAVAPPSQPIVQRRPIPAPNTTAQRPAEPALDLNADTSGWDGVARIRGGAPGSSGAEDDLDGDLNEDDDEDEDDANDDAEPETTNLVLAQFDKVSRTKNKWKCSLKDGIMHINGKDVVFAKAQGEFEW
eukprot:jgi/Chlat1/1531/Chrsp122S01803